MRVLHLCPLLPCRRSAPIFPLFRLSSPSPTLAHGGQRRRSLCSYSEAGKPQDPPETSPSARTLIKLKRVGRTQQSDVGCSSPWEPQATIAHTAPKGAQYERPKRWALGRPSPILSRERASSRASRTLAHGGQRRRSLCSYREAGKPQDPPETSPSTRTLIKLKRVHRLHCFHIFHPLQRSGYFSLTLPVIVPHCFRGSEHHASIPHAGPRGPASKILAFFPGATSRRHAGP